MYQVPMSRNIKTFKETIDFIRDWYGKPTEFLPLHVPVFQGREKELLIECIDSTFVSSVGKFVDEVEKKFAERVGTKYAVAVVNGTSALHLALKVAGVKAGDEVLTQPFTFVATGNAIRYQNASPVFVDISRQTLGLNPKALAKFLEANAQIKNGVCYNKKTGKILRACMPMHTYGHPVELDEIKQICDSYHIVLIEDAAESVGSYYKGRHTGITGVVSAFSFNGNKTITCGGGGMLATNNLEMARHAKHLSTVAKTAHPYEFFHDELGYNYRMPNLNAALLLAQMEQLPVFLQNKRDTALAYRDFFREKPELTFFEEPPNCHSNYWLNVVFTKDKASRDEFLQLTNKAGIMTRPAWRLLVDLPEFNQCQYGDLTNARYLEQRLVNITSSVKS